jgi:hypothetical protein
MQPTTRFQHGITKAILPEADVVCHHPVAFPPAHGVCYPGADGGQTTIRGVLRRGECPAPWCLFGLDHRDVGQDEALAAPLLLESTSGRHVIALQLRQGVIMALPFRGRTQAAKLTGVIDPQAVCDRLACLVAAGVVLLVCWIGWAVDRPLRTLMPTRGEGDPSWGRLLVRSVAHAAAVRAGSRSCGPHAWLSTV